MVTLQCVVARYNTSWAVLYCLVHYNTTQILAGSPTLQHTLQCVVAFVDATHYATCSVGFWHYRLQCVVANKKTLQHNLLVLNEFGMLRFLVFFAVFWCYRIGAWFTWLRVVVSASAIKPRWLHVKTSKLSKLRKKKIWKKIQKCLRHGPRWHCYMKLWSWFFFWIWANPDATTQHYNTMCCSVKTLQHSFSCVVVFWTLQHIVL